MKDNNIYKAKDVAGDVEDQLTGGCFSVPVAAVTLIFLIIAALGSFF